MSTEAIAEAAIRDSGDRRAGGGAASSRLQGVLAKVGAYLALTKPRIVELLVITAVPSMVAASQGLPSIKTLVSTLFGGALSAGGANAINNYFDRDIDERMARTSSRPLPARRVEPRKALVFGAVLGLAGFVFLGVTTNWLAASLATAALLFYVVIYTLYLKRRTPQNIVIGGAAGGVPALVAWAAVKGKVELPGVILFFLVFYWTPPHFWALAIKHEDDYRKANVPMLPVTRGICYTARQIVLYSWLTVATSLLFYSFSGAGIVYLAAAILLGVELLRRAYVLRSAAESEFDRSVTLASAIDVFRYSNVYLALLSAAIVVDVLARS